MFIFRPDEIVVAEGILKKCIHISKVPTLYTTKETQESGGPEIKNAEKPCNESDPMPPKFY